MALDRDELAARCLVARLTDVEYASEPIDAANAAVAMADALLARLSQDRPAALSRPEWVRITSNNKGGDAFTKVGKVYRVTGWSERGCPQITTDLGDTMWNLSNRGLLPDDVADTFASWEPCAPPSPAATPAAYVPQVGDVVRHRQTADEKRFLWLVVSPSRMVKLTEPRLMNDGMTRSWWAAQVFVRRATSSERAAAGLPVDASPAPSVDREGLVRAIKDAWLRAEVGTGRCWYEAADAAIAFMAKGGA